jgi:hypothetical protein
VCYIVINSLKAIITDYYVNAQLYCYIKMSEEGKKPDPKPVKSNVRH